MLIKIIIDRVGNTNVFNIIEDKAISNPFLKENESLQSIIDDDLIEEYLDEIGRIAKISRSLSSLPKENEENQALIFQHLNLNSKLRQTGEAIFRQFFPEPLQAFIRGTGNAYLFFHIDKELSSLPLEILHDGSAFLWERFYLGKSVKGQHSAFDKVQPKQALNMLIIADPTEDLDWARKEGEALFEHLSSKFPEKKLNLELIGGRSITKLTLLNALLNKDIIHYSGHLHYAKNPAENGWILFGNKIMHAREVERSGASPLMIFSNSCLSGRGLKASKTDANWYTNFASSFLKSGQTNYIGTNWELPDSEPTLSFTIHFYDSLLKGESIGKSLQESRLYARENFTLNDLTWASYLLMGNPLSRIFQAETKVPDLTQNILDYEMVVLNYPYPIAQAFQKFLDVNSDKLQFFNEKEKNEALLESLLELFGNTVFFLSAVVIANYNFLNLPNPVYFRYPDVDECIASAFEALGSINALKVPTLMPNLLETLFVHRDNLTKISGWAKEIRSQKLDPDTIESYVITMQYLLEGLLMDIEFVKNYGFYRVVEPGHRQLSLSGLRNQHRIKEIILPTQANAATQDELLKKTEELIGHCVFYNPVKKVFLDLNDHMEIEITAGPQNTQEYLVKFRGQEPPSSPKKGGKSKSAGAKKSTAKA